MYGVDFSDVYMRGSQFKVESFMFRLAKPESLLLQTPSKDEVRSQLIDLPESSCADRLSPSLLRSAAKTEPSASR